MKLSREDALHIAALARVGFTEEDLEKFREQLSNILENFEVLKQVDTSNVKPTATVTDIQNVLRPDEVQPSLPTEEIMANAPNRDGDFFRVKAILDAD